MGSPALSARGRSRRELRLRVDALRRQRERQVRADPLSVACEVDAQSGLHADLASAPPLTLAFQIGEEFRRRRRLRVLDDEMLQQVRGWAMNAGRWAIGRDPSLRVCATFAVEHALHVATRMLPFDTHPPDCMVGGEPYNSVFDGLNNKWTFGEADPDWPNPLSLKSRASIRRLTIDWLRARGEGVVPANWQPEKPKTVLTCDAMRPPVEAMILAAESIQPSAGEIRLRLDEHPSVLCVGCGWGGAAQALSVRLPLYRVCHRPIPFAEKDQPDLDLRAVVINVPSARDWRAARVARTTGATPARIQRKLFRSQHDRSSKHVEEIVGAAASRLQPGCLVVLMADYAVHDPALDHLRGVAHLAPEQVRGLGERSIWVGYEKPPWAPHGFPRPSGRLESFWRVTP